MARTDIIMGLAGSGGDGVIAAGEAFLTAAAMDGLYGQLTKSFGPQIRGGESSSRLRISLNDIQSPGDELDVLVVFSWPDFKLFAKELVVGEGTLVIYDNSKDKTEPADIPLEGKEKCVVIPLEITNVAKEKAGIELAKNIVSLGIMAELFNIAPENLQYGIKKRFAKKSEEIVNANLAAFDAGRVMAKELCGAYKAEKFDHKPGDPKIIIDGNDAVGAGAIFSGCDFFGGYPITPSTEVMQYMSRELPRFDGTMLQAEDEIAAIAAVAGASFAGAKPLTVTSGPGMCLKSEILGMCTIAELPMVAVNVQRGGPSTGIPTKGEQADLFQAVYSAHGDAVRPVLAASNVMGAFRMTVEAFNIAEYYQTPVVLLTDGYMAQTKSATDPVDPSSLEVIERKKATEKDLVNGVYDRFKLTEDFISPMAIPGTPNLQYLSSGIEHDEHGAPRADYPTHEIMNNKRMQKLEPLKKRDDLILRLGDKDSDFGIITWGSSSGPVIEALELCRKEFGIKGQVLIPQLIYPVPPRPYEDFFKTVKRCLFVEINYLQQLYTFLKGYVDIPKGTKVLNHSGGRLWTLKEIIAKIKEMNQ